MDTEGERSFCSRGTYRTQAGKPLVADSIVAAMRILACALEAPLPPLNGARLQIKQVCDRLANDHELLAIAYRHPEQDEAPSTDYELRMLEHPPDSAFAKAVRVLTDPRPTSVARFGPPMLDAIGKARAERDFDVVLFTGWTLSGIARKLAPLPAVLSALDASHLNAEAKRKSSIFLWKGPYALEERRIKRYERKHATDHSSVLLVTEEDAKAVRALQPLANAIAIPNGVDSDFYSPDPTVTVDPNLIVFTGAMQWAPNSLTATHLAEEVFPLVRERRPEARLALVGRLPGPEVLRLGKKEGVEVTGSVPTVVDWLRRCAVFACTMTAGTGIKNKLLEAMAAGAPSVASPLACQGIAAEDGRDLLVAEGPRAQADAILALLADRDQARELGASGREFVVNHHGWDRVADRYEAELRAAAADASFQVSAP